MEADGSLTAGRDERPSREAVSRAVLDGWPHGFVVLDAAACVVDFNRRFEELLGLDSERSRALRGASCEALLGACSRELLEPAELANWLACDDEPQRVALRSGLVIDVSSHALRGPQSFGRLLVFEDASARLRREDQHRMAERRMRELERIESLGSLAGGIAHEFNNLLTGILGSAELVLEQLPAGDARRRPLERVLEAGGRAAKLCEDMVASAGFGAFEVRRAHLSDLAHRWLRRFQQGAPSHLRVEEHLAAELPPVALDELQIGRVFENVFVNAADAVAPSGGVVRVSTGARAMSLSDLDSFVLWGGLTAGDYAWFEIEDDGAGMDKATQARMFDPFFSTKFPGRGLGLFNAARIVRGHRGAIEVDSHPGSGTRVRVILPVST